MIYLVDLESVESLHKAMEDTFPNPTKKENGLNVTVIDGPSAFPSHYSRCFS